MDRDLGLVIYYRSPWVWNSDLEHRHEVRDKLRVANTYA